MLNSLQNNVIAAIILVLIIILGALGVRSGLLVGLSIPGSFLSGLLALSIMGFTINIVVLFALILSVGLLVDGAIVVVEYADRKLKEGLSVVQAYADASKKMALPITFDSNYACSFPSSYFLAWTSWRVHEVFTNYTNMCPHVIIVYGITFCSCAWNSVK